MEVFIVKYLEKYKFVSNSVRFKLSELQLTFLQTETITTLDKANITARYCDGRAS